MAWTNNPLSRRRAALLALYFGFAPSGLYELERHYTEPYLVHALKNISYAFRWILNRQTPEDELFELLTNPPGIRLLAQHHREKLEVNVTLVALAAQCLKVRLQRFIQQHWNVKWV